MAKTFFTSDIHFCHARDFLYNPRGFSNVHEMNETIVENWNNVVNNEDTVYVLGDIILNDLDTGLRYWKKLNGHKKIICGNHDTPVKIMALGKQPNTTILGYADMIKFGKFQAYLSHYPTMMGNFDENFGPICLHGHTHSNDPFQYAEHRCYNVAMDAHNCTPISIEEIRADIRKYRGVYNPIYDEEED